MASRRSFLRKSAQVAAASTTIIAGGSLFSEEVLPDTEQLPADAEIIDNNNLVTSAGTFNQWIMLGKDAAGNAIWGAQELSEDKPIFVQFWDGTIAKIVPVVRGTKEMALRT